jgi:hypothetical protein
MVIYVKHAVFIYYGSIVNWKLTNSYDSLHYRQDELPPLFKYESLIIHQERLILQSL